MIYGLHIHDSWNFCDPSESFAPSYGPVTDKDIFGVCLEQRLQDWDGKCSLPWRQDEAWTFWKANSEKELTQGDGELICTLHGQNKDALWELIQWANGSCVSVRLNLDY